MSTLLVAIAPLSKLIDCRLGLRKFCNSLIPRYCVVVSSCTAGVFSVRNPCTPPIKPPAAVGAMRPISCGVFPCRLITPPAAKGALIAMFAALAAMRACLSVCSVGVPPLNATLRPMNPLVAPATAPIVSPAPYPMVNSFPRFLSPNAYLWSGFCASAATSPANILAPPIAVDGSASVYCWFAKLLSLVAVFPAALCGRVPLSAFVVWFLCRLRNSSTSGLSKLVTPSLVSVTPLSPSPLGVEAAILAPPTKFSYEATSLACLLIASILARLFASMSSCWNPGSLNL